jgi:hypothetical protein
VVKQTGAMKTPVESYVVRIYRNEREQTRRAVGLVEAPHLAGSQPFANAEQLWQILMGGDVTEPGKPDSGPADSLGS